MDPENMPKAHPHAALMAQYAQDAAETAEPWTRWECRDSYGRSWIGCNCSPFWHVNILYRRKLNAPPAVGVSDEQIRSLWQTTDTGDFEDDIMSFARAILDLSPASKPEAPANNQGD